jgi:hypothetical protein
MEEESEEAAESRREAADELGAMPRAANDSARVLERTLPLAAAAPAPETALGCFVFSLPTLFFCGAFENANAFPGPPSSPEGPERSPVQAAESSRQSFSTTVGPTTAAFAAAAAGPPAQAAASGRMDECAAPPALDAAALRGEALAAAEPSPEEAFWRRPADDAWRAAEGNGDGGLSEAEGRTPSAAATAAAAAEEDSGIQGV